MPSRAAPAAGAVMPPCAAGATADLWAKAAELERDFAGYKRRLAERREHAAAAVAGRGADEVRGGGGGGEEVAGRGRRYEEYVRRRDERLRHEWRARMERKEAEMKALWARLDRSASRRGGGGGDGDGELAAAGLAGEKKPGNLEVKVKPAAAPVTPRCSPAAKLSRPRTGVPSSPAAASPKLSTPDARRRASHSQRGSPPAAEPPATPRKDTRLPIAAPAPAPGTPRPRTMMSRSRTMLRDRGGGGVGESPRPPRLQPPRSSCDGGGSNRKEPARTPDVVDAIAVMQSSPSFSDHVVLAELFRLRSSGNGAEPAPSPLLPPRDEPGRGEIARAGGNAGNKTDGEQADRRSADKFAGVEITGDSDTEPSYVYIKKDGDEQAPRPSHSQPTSKDGEPLSEEKDIANVEEPMASPDADAVAGEAPAADEEEASPRESSESLYSNVQSSFSRGSELDASATDSPPLTVPSPEAAAAAARLRKNPEEEEEETEEISVPMASTPVSGVTVSITVQSPMDAVAGLRRFLTFGKRNGRAGEVAAAVVQRAPPPHAVAPAGDDSISGGWPAGDPVKATLGSPDAAASDDMDSSYVISPHVGSSQNCVPSYPANAERKEAVLQAKSPRVHRSFFPFASFKSRAN
ncbi:hypothetical protein ACP4OV_017573 [Aristida adscensionis]